MTSTSAPPVLDPPVLLGDAYADPTPSGWDLAALPVLTGSDIGSTVSFADLSRRFVLDLVAARASTRLGLDPVEASLPVLRDSTRAACALLSPYALDGTAVVTDAEHAGVRLGADGSPDAAWFASISLTDAEPEAVGAHLAGLLTPVAERVAEATGRAPAETVGEVAEVLAVEIARLARECALLDQPRPDVEVTLGAVLRGALEALGEEPREVRRAARAS